jgi:hypothetical protein
MQEAEKYASECAMRRLREGRSDGEDDVSEPFVDQSGRIVGQVVSMHAICARFLSRAPLAVRGDTVPHERSARSMCNARMYLTAH